METNTDNKTLALIKQRLDEAERNIQYVRHVLEENEEVVTQKTTPAENNEQPQQDEERIIEGVFDGQDMQGSDGSEYPVPPNYASKSKLVEGDVLKLTINPDGSFVYKQINPVERRRINGTLTIDEQGNFQVETAEGKYKVLLASVTFFKAEEGDEITLLLPENAEAEWGAVENVLHH